MNAQPRFLDVRKWTDDDFAANDEWFDCDVCGESVEIDDEVVEMPMTDVGALASMRVTVHAGCAVRNGFQLVPRGWVE